MERESVTWCASDRDGRATRAATPAGVLAALRDAGFEIGPAAGVTTSVLDSADGRLHRAGLRLELRESSGRELVLTEQGSTPAHLPVPAAPRFPDELPRGPFRDRLATLLEVRALLPRLVLTSRATHAARRNSDGKTVAVVRVDEDVVARSPERGDVVALLPWSATLLPVAGHPSPGARVAALLDDLGLERGQDPLTAATAATGIDPRGLEASPLVPLDPQHAAVDGFVTVLAHLAGTAAAHWQGTIDDVDSEFLHDLRVAVRRSRSVLAQARGVVPDDVRDRFREELRWLGEITGPARDLDVFLLEWGDYVAPLAPSAQVALQPVRAHLQRQQSNAHEVLSATLAAERARGVLDGWRGWLASSPTGDGAPAARDPLGTVVARRIRRAQRTLIERGRSIDAATPAEELHELRKDGKKLRYLIECFGGLLGTRERKAFVQRLKVLQDNLGEHQDAEVHVARLHQLPHEMSVAGAPADTIVAIGQLAERLDQRRAGARAEFGERFAEYDTKPTRQALDELLAPLERLEAGT